jgi:hypothetical protein
MIGAVMSSLPSSSGISNMGGFGALFGVIFMVIMPIAGFIGGLTEGAVIAFLYNFFAPRIGGVKIRFKEETNVPPQPPMQ